MVFVLTRSIINLQPIARVVPSWSAEMTVITSASRQVCLDAHRVWMSSVVQSYRSLGRTVRLPIKGILSMVPAQVVRRCSTARRHARPLSLMQNLQAAQPYSHPNNQCFSNIGNGGYTNSVTSFCTSNTNFYEPNSCDLGNS